MAEAFVTGASAYFAPRAVPKANRRLRPPRHTRSYRACNTVRAQRDSKSLTPSTSSTVSDSTTSSGGASSVLSLFCPLLKLLSGAAQSFSLLFLFFVPQSSYAGTVKEMKIRYRFVKANVVTVMTEHSVIQRALQCSKNDISKLGALHDSTVVKPGGDAAAPRNRFVEVATSGIASLARLPFGTTAGAASLRDSDPAETLILAEFEACPFCRRVREALVDLDLEVDVWPTPKDSVRHRQQVLESGGKLQFPFLLDRNTEPATQLYESEAIVQHLYRNYGNGSEPPQGLMISTFISGWVPTLLRAGRGMVRYSSAQSAAPQQQLILWDYDGNQFSRLVREALCELEIPYRRVACGKGSKRWPALRAASGQTTCPYLIDPNTNTSIQDSQQAVSYLFSTYSNDGESNA